MRCRQCGANNDNRAVVCYNCGNSLHGRTNERYQGYPTQRTGGRGLLSALRNVSRGELLVSWICFFVAMSVPFLFWVSIVGIIAGIFSLIKLNFWALIPIVLNAVALVFGVLFSLGFTGIFFLRSLLGAIL